jgi:hypothetical protein
MRTRRQKVSAAAGSAEEHEKPKTGNGTLIPAPTGTAPFSPIEKQGREENIFLFWPNLIGMIICVP